LVRGLQPHRGGQSAARQNIETCGGAESGAAHICRGPAVSPFLNYEGPGHCRSVRLPSGAVGSSQARHRDGAGRRGGGSAYRRDRPSGTAPGGLGRLNRVGRPARGPGSRRADAGPRCRRGRPVHLRHRPRWANRPDPGPGRRGRRSVRSQCRGTAADVPATGSGPDPDGGSIRLGEHRRQR
jgi:hypothetical protein